MGPGAMLRGGRRALSGGVGFGGSRGTPGGVRPFEAIPRSGNSRWLELYRFWRDDGIQRFHRRMERNFQRLGPIYRETLGTYDSVNVLLPADAARLFMAEGPFPRRMGIEAWSEHRRLRGHQRGVFLLNGEQWRSDRLQLNGAVLSPEGSRRFAPLLDAVARDFVTSMLERLPQKEPRVLTLDLRRDLFRFALEASSYALYGSRLGLLGPSPPPAAQRFIAAVDSMLRSTAPLLFVPPRLLRLLRHPLWRRHERAWDDIYGHADRCIQKLCQEFGAGRSQQSVGIMAELLLRAELPLDAVRANLTEFTAGGVDTTAVPLLFALFELARNPAVQEELRAEIRAAERHRHGGVHRVLGELPLLRAAIKETLRLYPVGVTVQRYPARDVVLHNYRVPKGTLCQVALYAMGRSPAVFAEPQRFDPSRWIRRSGNETAFTALGFGFGARQCIGRRLAETEMALCLLHILQHFSVETQSREDPPTIFSFVLMPEKSPPLRFRPLP